jgi:hypothetical protein
MLHCGPCAVVVNPQGHKVYRQARIRGIQIPDQRTHPSAVSELDASSDQSARESVDRQHDDGAYKRFPQLIIVIDTQLGMLGQKSTSETERVKVFIT